MFYFFCSHKLHKIKNDSVFEQLEKKIIILLFTEKTVTKLLEIWVGDPRSAIRDSGSVKKTIPDRGVRKAPDPGSKIRNTA
jgi:hypothetical protein